MTTERADEIKNISKEVTAFINALANKYDDIDFLLFEIKIENHSDEEKEEKETLLKILVNDCKANPISRDETRFETEDDNNDELNKSTNKVNSDSNDEDGSHYNKSSDKEAIASKNKEENIEDTKRESDKPIKAAKSNTESKTTAKDPKPTNKTDSHHEKSDNEVNVNDNNIDNKANGVNDSKLTINYNFNGNFDNSNLYISPDISQVETGKSYNELYETLLRKINRNISPNNRNLYTSPLQNVYDQPRGFGYLNYQPSDYYDNPNEIDDLWNIMMEKLKREENPKNCVYALKKICGAFEENEKN